MHAGVPPSPNKHRICATPRTCSSQTDRQTDRQIDTDRFVTVDARDAMQLRNRGGGEGGRIIDLGEFLTINGRDASWGAGLGFTA
jgi:hypothetical protein